MKKSKSLLLAAVLFIFITSCDKDDNPPTSQPKVTTGLYVLSEGLMSMNNTTLTYYDLKAKTATTDFYKNANGSELGDTGNDFIIYGAKLYIAMNGASYIEVADARTAISIKKLDMKDGTTDRQPRSVIAYKNKVMVTSYDGTVAVIDTSSLAIEKIIPVGSNPEQMTISGNNLFVANSGGLNYPVYDSTVSVIDLNTYIETKKIKVGTNPSRITADNNGNVFVVCTGNYADIKPKIVSINASTYAIQKSVEKNVGVIRCSGNFLYCNSGYGGAVKITVLNTSDLSVAKDNFITDGTSIATPYGLTIDDETGDIYVSDAKDYVSAGEVFCFDKTGKKKFSFSVSPGINPNKVALIKQ